MRITKRKAKAVDPTIKSANMRRLRRIEGQVRGIQKMVEDERYCADILMQISSVQQALQGVSRELMRNHLQHCADHAARKGPRAKAYKVYDEIIDLMYRHV
jgi:DNA-binding FrmR family transcriptional regulator